MNTIGARTKEPFANSGLGSAIPETSCKLQQTQSQNAASYTTNKFRKFAIGDHAHTDGRTDGRADGQTGGLCSATRDHAHTHNNATNKTHVQ